MADRPARGRKRSPRVARTGGGAPHQVAATAFPVGRSSAVTAFVLAVFTVIFVGLAVHAYTQTSAVWDEPIHFTAGYAGLAKHDFRIDPSHPPFLRLWAALPSLLVGDVSMSDVPADSVPVSTWLPDAYAFAHRFLYLENDADRLLYRGRFMIVLLGVLLGVFVFLWTREWLGLAPAVAAVCFFAFEPNLSAHASLVTTDLGVTCFIFGTIYFTWLTCRRCSPRAVIGLMVCFSLSMVSKFSAVLLVPLVVILLALGVRRHQGLTSRRVCAILAGLAVAAIAAIWATYGFRYLPAESATAAFRFDATERAAAAPIIGVAANWIDAHRLLPNAYMQGFLYAYSSVQRLPGFLAGRVSDEGWWSYFPVAILLKTPTPLIVMVCAGLVALYRRRRDCGVDVPFIVLPITVFLGVPMWSGINVGLRHVLPVYPFALLLAALAARELARLPYRMRFIATAVLAVVWSGEYASAYPHTLTFFNSAAGGPGNGFRYLSDSNLAWGQSLKALKVWMEQHQVPHVNLAYFGQADPAYYGINCTHLPGAPSFAAPSIARPKLPGYVAISATTLTGVYAPPSWRLFYAAFRDLKPAAIVGNSIRVYWVDEWPEPEHSMDFSGELEAQRSLADALLFGFRWPEHAARHYRTYLAAHPADIDALVDYGVALSAAKQSTEAVAALRQALSLDPSYGRAHLLIGELFMAARDIASAANHAEQAVRLLPNNPDAHFLIARVHAVQGRRKDTARDLARVFQLQPGHAAAQDLTRRLAAAPSP